MQWTAHLPSGSARELLRQKGQFWTPPWLADVMARWVLLPGPARLFDPAVGPGTFFTAARRAGFHGQLAGFELDPSVLAMAREAGLNPGELQDVVVGDFLAPGASGAYPAIVSNPPYIRHHRLGRERKQQLRALAVRSLGFPLDGRTGLHVFFLLRCLEMLDPGGRLAFLLPADACEGVSSSRLWGRLTEQFRLDAVLTFAPGAAPFPGVDTNALVVLLSKRPRRETVIWLRVGEPDGAAILTVLRAAGEGGGGNGVSSHLRPVIELVTTGLSRPPRCPASRGLPLSALARVMRGIATGANEFFFLTSRQIHERGLDRRFFHRAVGRTRDCPGDSLTRVDLEALDRAGRPTWLLCLEGQPMAEFPARLREYLELAEAQGLAHRRLLGTRRPWYRMERRLPPPLLFAYLGRRDCRFVANGAGVVPLTGFLCVYPRDDRPEPVRRLWRALNHPATQANLAYVGKSYGAGAIKVEPRQLDRLEIPAAVVDEFGLATGPG